MLLLLLGACAQHIPAPTTPYVPLPAARTMPPAPTLPAAPLSAPESPTGQAASGLSEGAPPLPPGVHGSALHTPPAALRVCWVEYATGTLPRRFAVAHGAMAADVPATMSGLVFVHPAGTWLLDGGPAVDALAHLEELSGLFGITARATARGWTRVGTPAEALRAAGFATEDLTGALLSHGHYDHLGGLLDLPTVPIWAAPAELAAAEAALRGESAPALPSEARALLARAHALAWDGPPVGPWPTSHDLYGDGSVRLLPLSGHTPGHLGALLQLADGRRVLVVGDTVWAREGYAAREPRAKLIQTVDSAPADNDLQIQRLWQIHVEEPDVLVLPAHDRRQWEALFGTERCIR